MNFKVNSKENINSELIENYMCMNIKIKGKHKKKNIIKLKLREMKCK